MQNRLNLSKCNIEGYVVTYISQNIESGKKLTKLDSQTLMYSVNNQNEHESSSFYWGLI